MPAAPVSAPAPAPALAGPRPLRVMLAAAVATTLGTLPVFLVGGLAVFVRADLGFSETGLGLTASVFFGTSALCSVLAGRVSERLGAFAATIIAMGISVASLLGVALAVRSFPALLVFLALGGVGNAFAQIGSNLSLARGVPADRQGLAFGVKQAAIPVATLVAGLAVPVIALTVGWRWAFGLAALSALGFLPLAPRVGRSPRPSPGERLRQGDAATGALVVVGAGAGLGAVGNSGLGTFLVESAVASGVGPGPAGLLLALGSGLGICVRLAIGWSADRREGGHLPIVAGMMAGGAAGLALLALASGGAGRATLVAGTVLGFAAGWSWPGLLNFAIVRLSPRAPGAATSITQTGVFAGGALGPLAFGALVERTSYSTAWLVGAGAFLVATVLLLAGRRLLIADRTRRAETERPRDQLPSS